MKKIFAIFLFIPALSFAAPCSNSKDVQSFNLCAFDREEAAFSKLSATYRRALSAVEASGADGPLKKAIIKGFNSK